jgi:hypothetical protein
MGLNKFILFLVINLFLIVSPAFADNYFDDTENYLIGMTITKFNENNYIVSLQMENDTNKQYFANDIGNNIYIIKLPQVKSIIDKNKISFNEQHPDIDVVISENKNFTNKNKFYTKIKFKAPTTVNFQVQTYGRSEKDSFINTDILKQKKLLEEQEQNNFSKEILYILTFVLILLFILICRRTKENKKANDEPITLSKIIPITERNNEIFENAKKNSPKESLTEFKHKKEIEREKENKQYRENDIPTEEETNKVIDELVKIVISKNDLVLMPGVPELPGLETKTNKTENTKAILKDVKIDLYDAENIIKKENENKKYQNDQTSLSYRLKNKENIQETEQTIKEEKDEILGNISTLNEIPQNIIIEAPPEEEIKETDEYDKLIKAFEKSLRIAHKIKENQYAPVEITDAFAIDENRGFSLVKMGEKTSLVGNIGEKIFIIKTFTEEEINKDTLFMEFCTQTPTYQSYSVILNKFKGLIKVSQTDISLIGTYN